MSTAPEIPYTDRNVREDPTLSKLAYDYLNRYGGSFKPLVDAQELLYAENGLPTSVIRVVLNCMRHDTTVATSMPAPTPYITSVPAPAQRQKRRRRSFAFDDDEYISCGKTASHESHGHRINDETFYCKGIPFAINRGMYYRPATVKTPYARARTGKLWHHVAMRENNAEIAWFPNHHEEGFSPILSPELTVSLICKYPGRIHKPILMRSRPADDISEFMYIEECPHCRTVLQTPPELRA